MRNLEHLTHSRNECSYTTSYDMADCILGILATGPSPVKKYHTSATTAGNLVMTVDDLPATQENDYIVAIVSIWYKAPESSAPTASTCYSLMGPIVYGMRTSISVPSLPRSSNLECFFAWSTNPLKISLSHLESREGTWNFDLYVLL